MSESTKELSKLEILKARVRETPLPERLIRSRLMLAKMCSERRPPRMSIPVYHEDEDFYISTTLADALAAMEQKS
jgi:hypothetical protein